MPYPAGQQLSHALAQPLLQLLCKLFLTSPGLCVCFNRSHTGLVVFAVTKELSSPGRMKPGTLSFCLVFYILRLIFHRKSE